MVKNYTVQFYNSNTVNSKILFSGYLQHSKNRSQHVHFRSHTVHKAKHVLQNLFHIYGHRTLYKTHYTHSVHIRFVFPTTKIQVTFLQNFRHHYILCTTKLFKLEQNFYTPFVLQKRTQNIYLHTFPKLYTVVTITLHSTKGSTHTYRTHKFHTYNTNTFLKHTLYNIYIHFTAQHNTPTLLPRQLTPNPLSADDRSEPLWGPRPCRGSRTRGNPGT